VTTATVKVHTAGEVVHVALAGEIDLANAATVEEEIFAAVDNTAATVVIDLTDVLYLDSSGLRILFLLAGRLQMLQIGMEVVAPAGSPIRRVIEVFGLEPFVVLRP
jgi:anti-anti-sigma factor